MLLQLFLIQWRPITQQNISWTQTWRRKVTPHTSNSLWKPWVLWSSATCLTKSFTGNAVSSSGRDLFLFCFLKSTPFFGECAAFLGSDYMNVEIIWDVLNKDIFAGETVWSSPAGFLRAQTGKSRKVLCVCVCVCYQMLTQQQTEQRWLWVTRCRQRKSEPSGNTFYKQKEVLFRKSYFINTERCISLIFLSETRHISGKNNNKKMFGWKTEQQSNKAVKPTGRGCFCFLVIQC